MRLTVLELPAQWGRAPAVLDEIDRTLAAGAPTDLVLLPEAALHGYVSPDGDFDLTRFAEPIDGPIAARAASLARAHRTHLVAPLVLREGAAVSNAIACFDPTGAPCFVYRKRHPWFPETWATPGPAPHPLVEIAGITVTAAICFDLHFLADDAARELAAADLLLFPSAWVEEVDSRPQLLGDLARRFDIHIANANWAAGDVVVPGQGGSCVIDQRGEVIARVDRRGAGVRRVDVEI
ncbi:MAG: carbon-nitrogen hydrolase family protein [Deltaproteobacteria bacterium]|nr:carbon-nitrogen hydrolase family protein [Deltaproteobacteria bacterium]